MTNAPDFSLDAERVERLVRRHIPTGRSEADARAWVRRVDRPNAEVVEAAAGRADVVLDLSDWSGQLRTSS